MAGKIKDSQEIKKELYKQIKQYYLQAFKNKPKQSSIVVPCSGKLFDEKELIMAVDAVLDCWWTEGDKTKEFVHRMNSFLGTKHCIVVNSGSSANLIAVQTLCSKKLGERRLKPGDEIISVAAGFPTTINPIIQSGCIPVFCDVDFPTYNINISQMKKGLSKKTKAVFIAHTLGNPFNLDEVVDFCKKNNLWLIEDNCDALGSTYKGKKTGTFGDISTLSFYPAHHITMGEGGAVCTSNPLLAKIALSLRDWGRDCWCATGQDNTCKKRFEWQLGNLPYGYDHKYIYSEIGYNLKNTDLNVAIGLAQMDKLQKFIETRKRNFNILKKELAAFSRYFILPEATVHSDPSWFGFLITLKKGSPFTREELISYLNVNHIGTRMLFGGNITKQPYFVEYNPSYRIVDNLKNTDTLMKNTFWIGVQPNITSEMLKYVVKTFKEFISLY